MSKAWGSVLVVTGFIACPCHLIITLPLVLGLMAGTGAGAILAANTGLIYVIAGGYFVAALAAGWYLLNRKRPKAGPARARGVPSDGRHLKT